MIENFTEQGVRHAALNMAWRVVFAWWFTVLLLVGIGVWWITSRAMATDFTSGTWIATCSASMATMMLLFNVSCRYVEYRVGRAERMLKNTQKINARLNRLLRETSKGELLNSRDVLLELIDIAEGIYFQEVDLTRINMQYAVFIQQWLMENKALIKSFVELEHCDIRVLILVAHQMKGVGDEEEELFKV
ncbi:MAG: hypothetical protein LBT80_07475 [Lactobacillaceae bacterium]|jgi:hypothetical protein|nr:hypothetical protein [Lactobacillaceae bacterium]